MSLKINYNAEPILRDFQRRAKFFYLAMALLLGLLFFRLIQLQLVQGDLLYTFSEKNLLKETQIKAPRGIIFDREMRPLVENVPNFALTLSLQFVKDKEEALNRLHPIIEMPVKQIEKRIKKQQSIQGRYRPLIIKTFLSRKEIIQIELLKIELQGINVEELIYRHYIYEDLFAHALGYTGTVTKRELPKLRKRLDRGPLSRDDIIGKRGLEQAFDQELRGVNGVSYVKIDAKGQQKLSETESFLGHIEDIPPRAGSNVKTTLDIDLQKAAQESFIKNKTQGALIAINKNGEVLSFINAPSYNPNLFSQGISMKEWSSLINNPDKPLRNRAVQDHHPPGSTFKTIVALASLQKELLREDTIVHAPSNFRFGRRTYHDHTRSGQGHINVKQALERSSNVFFYKQGLELGIDNIALYAKALGLGKNTQFDLNGESKGLIPSKKWKKDNIGEPWQLGENLSTAIGQGFVLVTPLQLAVAYMGIAQNGKIFRPHLVSQVLNSNQEVVKETPPQLLSDLSQEGHPAHISAETFRIVKQGLHDVANGSKGTARWAKVDGLKIAGKTGTAQVRAFSASEIYKSCANRPSKQRHHGWYVAFGPYESPEITVAVLAEHSCSSAKAVPVVRDFFQAYAKKYLSQPYAMEATESL